MTLWKNEWSTFVPQISVFQAFELLVVKSETERPVKPIQNTDDLFSSLPNIQAAENARYPGVNGVLLARWL